jgi:hypothetical protein
MIGRQDIVFSLSGTEPADTLDAVAREVTRRWDKAVYQDGETGCLFHTFADVPFGKLREILIYRDPASLGSWESLGAVPENAGSMIHVLLSGTQLTLVVDSVTDAQTKTLLDEVRGLLSTGLPGRWDAVLRPFARAA